LAGNNWATMLYWLYARLLMRQITVLPAHVCFMISGQDLAEAPENLYNVTAWCRGISAQVSGTAPGSTSGIRSLVSCIYAGLFLSAFMLQRLWTRALLLVVAAPLAIGMNFLRSLILTLLANLPDQLAPTPGRQSFSHDFGENGLVAASSGPRPKILVDCSSIGVEQSEAIRARLKLLGCEFISSPVSGNGKCVKAVKEALDTVPGVTGNTAAKDAKTFEVTGDFNDTDVFAALQKAGLTGKEK